MQTNAKRLEAVTLLALILLIVAAFYYWDFVESGHARTYNTLGNANLHVPTADLFLWVAAAIIVYSLTRIWGRIAGRVFELSEQSAETWRLRLLVVRVVATFAFLFLTFRTISTHVPDFIQKLPWP